MEPDKYNIYIAIVIRVTIVFTVGLLIWINNRKTLKKIRDKRKKEKELSELFKKEIIRPAIYLLVLYFIESIIAYFIFHHFSPTEVFFEILLICFIAVILYNKAINELEELESEDHLYSLNQMVEKIDNANQSIHALSFDDYNNFFDPVGLTYFLTQVKQIKHKNEKIEEENEMQKTKKPKINAMRIVVLKDKTKPHNKDLYKAITQSSNLTQSQQNLKNLIILHDISSINLYFYPEENALKHINDVEQKRINKITDRIREGYDSIFIDEIGYKPTGKYGDYDFVDIDDKVKTVAEKIFNEVFNNQEDFFIDNLDIYYKNLATSLFL